MMGIQRAFKKRMAHCFKVLFVFFLTFIIAECVHGTRICLVALPYEDSMLPFTALLEQLLSKSYAVTFTIHEEYLNWVDNFGGTDLIHINQLNSSEPKHSIPFAADSSTGLIKKFGRGKPLYNSLNSYLQDYLDLHNIMYPILKKAWKKHSPDFVVVDRFAFGGILACEEMGIPHAILNPSMLLDIDFPPLYVPAPLSGLMLSKQTVWVRLISLYHRLLFRLSSLNISHQISMIRTNTKLKNEKQEKLVITTTIFGFEDARPITPLQQMTGPLLPKPQNNDAHSSLLDWMDGYPSAVKFVVVALDDRTEYTEPIINMLADSAIESGMKMIIVLSPQVKKQLSQINIEHFADSNIFFVESVLDILSILENDRIFSVILSGQLSMTQAALRACKPVILIPSSPEQHEVAARVTNLYAGVSLDYEVLVPSDFTLSFHKLEEEQFFSWGVARLSLILLDSRGVSYASDIIIDALEHGIVDLHSRSARMAWWQFLQIDVYGVYGLVLCCMYLILRTIWGFLWALCGIDDVNPEDGQTSLSKHNKELGKCKHHTHQKQHLLTSQTKQGSNFSEVGGGSENEEDPMGS